MVTIPADDVRRRLAAATSDDPLQPPIGLAGNTYPMGKDTAGRYCMIDLHVLPGGPPDHRHDFEETFAMLEGKIEATFRGEHPTVRPGRTIHVPANAPHRLRNNSERPARSMCGRSPAGQAEFKAISDTLASKYRTGFLI